MPLFEVIQEGLGFFSGQKTQSFIVCSDHLPCSALGGQRVDSAPCAGSDGTVYGGAHEAENVVHGLASQSFSGLCLIPGLDAAPLFGFCIPGGCGEQLRLEIGEESRTQIGNRQIVNLGLEMGLVLAVVLVNVLPFASTPFKVGVHELTDCHIVAGSRVYTRDGDLGNEFCPFALDHWRPHTFVVPADYLPVTFALGISVAETIDAIRLSRLGVALFGRQAVENALELCFHVFSAGYVAHGDMITTKNLKGKMVIHSLSKTDFQDKKDEDNYLFFIILLVLFMATCEGQRVMISLAEESIQSRMPVTHWILSWQENEQPSREQVDEACVLANYVAGIVVGRWGRHAIRVARHGAMGLDKDRFRPVSKPVLLWSSWPNFCTTL